MSANIKTRPISKKTRDIGTMAPSSMIASIEEIFGGFPVVLSESDIPVLRALAKDEEMRSIPRAPGPWSEILEEVEKHGKIQVYAEY